jgi:hypothetical protein
MNKFITSQKPIWVEDIEVHSTDFELHDFLYYLSTASGIFPRRSKIDTATHKISGVASMSWFHVFPKDGEAKVITPSQKIGEMSAAGKAKVLPSGSIQSRMTSWLRRLWSR